MPVQSAVHAVQSAVHAVQLAVHSVQAFVHLIQSAVHSGIDVPLFLNELPHFGVELFLPDVSEPLFGDELVDVTRKGRELLGQFGQPFREFNQLGAQDAPPYPLPELRVLVKNP